MKKFIGFAITILLTEFLFAYEYKESTNGKITTAPWMISDNNYDTYWCLAENETEGWIEIVSDTAEKKDVVCIDCVIPENAKIQLYEENGNGKVPLSSCYKYGPFSGSVQLLLPEMRRESKVLGIYLSGINASEIKINEVNFSLREEKEWGKIVPESYSFNIKEQINIKPERLWDSKITGPWYEPLWYLPYEITKDNKENRVDEIFGDIIGEPTQKAEIIWNLDGKYKVETVKVYIQRSFRTIKVEFEENGDWKYLTEIGPYNQKDNSWIRSDVSNIVTDKLRITFPGGWEQSRFISELEIWGERIPGEEKGFRNWKELKGNYKNRNTYFVKNCSRKDLELEVSILRGQELPELYVNTYKVDSYKIKELNESKIVTYFVKKEYLRIGEQFFRFDNCFIETCLIREKVDKGIISENEGKFSIEKVIDITKDGRIVESNKRTIKGEDVISRTMYGSSEDASVCDIELYKPLGEDSFWNGCIIGWTGNSLDEVKINGWGVSRSDRLFFLPVERMNTTVFAGKLELRDNNQNFIYPIKGGKKQLGGTLACEESIEYVTADTYKINGTIINSNSRVYINGKEVSLKNWNQFEQDVQLVDGYQIIEICVKENSNITAYWTKEIYKLTESINISISGAENGIITQESVYTIKGYVWNAIKPKVYINNENIDCNNEGYFELGCDLFEGKNIYNIKVEDSLNRRAEKQIVIEKDTTPPVFEITNPENGYYCPYSQITITTNSEEKNLWYVIDNGVKEYTPINDYSKEFILEDNFYTWKIYAFDRVGNVSECKEVSFCIDTTKPESFVIYSDCNSDIEHWRNTNNVTVEFNTIDLTSGINRYEYLLDNSDWQVCESPLNLGVLKDGIHQLFVRAIDNAGNIRLENLSIYVDVTKPEEFIFTADINKSEWTSQNIINLYFNTTDATSGIKKYTLSIDGKEEFEFVSGNETPLLSDGKHILTIRAYDWADNITTSISEYYIDVTSPLSFEATFDIEGWSNNNSPITNYSTIDETSGILRYEIKIDQNNWQLVTTTYQFQKLEDGIHGVKIRAIDLAGNIAETDLYNLYIDTTAPLPVENCRLISGNGNMEGKWSTQDTDIIAYHVRWIVDNSQKSFVIEGQNIWEDGKFKEIILPNSSYKEVIDNGKKVSMFIQPEDKAHNFGQEMEATISLTGVSVVALKEEEPTAVEYEHITMAVPAMGNDSKIKGVMIKEVDSPVLHQNSTNPILSPIYSFTTLVDSNNDGNLTEQEHTNFDEEVLVFLTYDENIVPAGFPESNLEVYYYDDIWSRWFRTEKAAIDTEQNIIFFATKHFTDYSIQPTLLQDLTPEELKKAGHAYGNTESTVGDVVVSPESGTMMTESTEFIIHGKNGFEFPIKRMYDTQTARLDGPTLRTNMSIAFNFNGNIGKNILNQLANYGQSFVTDELKQLFGNFFVRNGDYNLAMGAGWRLSLPYIIADNSNVMVRLPNGSMYSTNQMDVTLNDSVLGTSHNLTLENHIGDDFTLSVKMRKSLLSDFETSLKAEDDVQTAGAIYDIYQATKGSHKVQGWVDTARSLMGWIIESATLTMKDGVQYEFSELGYIKEIRDPSGDNVIKFEYDGRLLTKIIDPYGNDILVEYSSSAFLRPYIKSFTKKDSNGNDKKITYEYDTSILNTIGNTFFAILPQLKSVTDFENRKTTFETDYSSENVLISGGGSAKINVALSILDIWPVTSAVKEILGVYSLTLTARYGIEWPMFIKKITAPEKGTYSINYNITDLSTMEVKPADYMFGIIPQAAKITFDFYQRLTVQSVSQINGNLSNTTNYDYTFKGYGSQHLVTKSVISNDQTITTNEYDVYKKKYYKYTCVGDNVLDIVSKATLATEESNWEKSYYTRLATSSVKKLNGEKYEEKSYTWDNEHGRILTEISERKNSWYKTNYKYDNWGNIVEQEEEYRQKDSSEKQRRKVTYNQYFNTDSTSIKDFPILENVKTEVQTVEGLRNLLIAQRIDDGYKIVDTANAYDSYGRIIWKGIYNEDHWAATQYEYVQKKEIEETQQDSTQQKEIDYASGNISKEITPLNQEINYEYQILENNFITTKTYKDTEIETQVANSIYTNCKKWEIDGNKNKTSYSYDSLGRVTSILYPGNKSEIISYDDTARTVTVKWEDDKVHQKYFYDNLHNLTRQELSDYYTGEQVISSYMLEYDKYNNVIKMIDPKNNETTYQYDEMNRLICQTNADKTTKRYDYDDNFSELYSYDEKDNLIYQKLSYDNLPEVEIKYNPYDIKTQNYYDGNGRLIKTVDPEGKITLYEYSAFGEISKVTKPAVEVYEVEKTFTVTPVEITLYNDLGLPEYKKVGYEDNYQIEQNTYDSLGRLIEVIKYSEKNKEISEKRKISYTYDNNGNVKTITEDGNTTSYEYTVRNLKKSETDPLNATISYEYDRNDKMIKMTDALGFDSSYKYDDLQRLVRAELPVISGIDSARIYTIAYDLVGNPTQMVEPNGKTTSYKYNNRNKKSNETISGNGCVSIEKEWIYDGCGNIKTLKEDGRLISYSYDNLNNLIETDYPDGQKEIKEYDLLSRVTSIKNAQGSSKSFAYNEMDLVIEQKDEEDNYSYYLYDVWGNQTYRKEENSQGSGNQIWNISYNSFNQPTKETKNDNTSITYEYNSRGLLSKKTDQKGISTAISYDSCGRVSSETRTFNSKTETKTYKYNSNGFITSVTDNGVTSIINELESNAYDLVTTLVTTVGTKTLNTSYKYDAGLKLSSVCYPDLQEIEYSNNALGQLVTITNGSTISYLKNAKYNSSGKLVSLESGNGKNFSNTWDSQKGFLTGYNWGLDNYISRSLTWDTTGNITSIQKGTTKKSYTNNYSYDRLGRLLTENNGADVNLTSKNLGSQNFAYISNDVSGKNNCEVTNKTVNLDYYASSISVDLNSDKDVDFLKIYGRNDRISPEHLEIWTKKDDMEWIHEENVTWEKDTVGYKVIFNNETKVRYIKLHSLWDERDENYNPVDKSTFSGKICDLIEVNYIANGEKINWEYDAHGNRLSATKNYENSDIGQRDVYKYYPKTDLIKETSTYYYNYDKNGNLIARGTKVNASANKYFEGWTFDAKEGELWTYEYDLQNRMTKVNYSNKGENSLKEIANYKYDYRGLLVKKEYSDYVKSDLVTVIDSKSNKVIEYYEYTVDGKLLHKEIENGLSTNYIWAETKLCCEVQGEDVYYHQTDHLGTTEVITDNTGTVVWEAGYEAFGSVMTSSGKSTFKPSFTGKMLDDCSGLYYFNARWYDSELGRFITQDPARDGVNWWGYCKGNPVNYTDKNGLKPGEIFSSIEDAASDFAFTYNDDSIFYNVEYFSAIYFFIDTEKNETLYSYTIPNKGDGDSVDMDLSVEDNQTVVSTVHAHAAYDSIYQNNIPSPSDFNTMIGDNAEYVSTPNGSLIQYNVDRTYSIIRTDIHSDKNDPNRKNETYNFQEDIHK